MNNKGQVTGVIIAVVLVIGVVAGLFAMYQGGLFSKQSGVDDNGGDNTNPTLCADSTATVTFNAFKAQDVSTLVGASYTVKRNGGNPLAVTGNSSSYGVGDKLEILASASNYINTVVDEVTVICGGQTVDIPMEATDTMTIRIFNSDGTSVLTDNAAGGAQNQSNIAEGGNLLVDVEIEGKDKQSSGDIIFAVEAGTSANVSSIVLSPKAGSPSAETVSAPTFYVDTLTSPKKAFFKIPAIVGAKKATYTIGFQLNSGKDLTGAVYTTAYSAEAFQDTDGTFKVGIENKDGTTKYEDTYDYDFFVAAS